MELEVTMMGVQGGVALGWVFTVEGGARVRVHPDGWGVMQGGRNESGWVRIGESLTSLPNDVLQAIKEDQELWNFKEDIKADSNGDMPRCKYGYPRIRELYEWAPWG